MEREDVLELKIIDTLITEDDMRLKHISPVKFLETEASFGIKDRYGNEIPLYTISANNYFEVIGNIYKNKNLLEESR